jgi:hypothetical protein
MEVNRDYHCFLIFISVSATYLRIVHDDYNIRVYERQYLHVDISTSVSIGHSNIADSHNKDDNSFMGARYFPSRALYCIHS